MRSPVSYRERSLKSSEIDCALKVAIAFWNSLREWLPVASPQLASRRRGGPGRGLNLTWPKGLSPLNPQNEVCKVWVLFRSLKFRPPRLDSDAKIASATEQQKCFGPRGPVETKVDLGKSSDLRLKFTATQTLCDTRMVCLKLCWRPGSTSGQIAEIAHWTFLHAEKFLYPPEACLGGKWKGIQSRVRISLMC